MSVKTKYRALAGAALPLLILALAVGFGGPSAPTPLTNIGEPFKEVDFSDAPALSRYRAHDGQVLAYRHYHASVAPRGSVVLIHGSTATSLSMHPLARVFRQAGYDAYALDIRGHGASGTRGTIGYVGQLEDDLAAFMRDFVPEGPTTLLGMSAGGGFTLRFAGSERQALFDNYLLLAPFISHQAPNYRPAAGGWVEIGLPRIVALTTLDFLGISQLGDLPVVRFAVDPANQLLTSAYSFELQRNFRPHMDYQADIAAAQRPVAVLAGSDDELFYSDKLEEIFREQGKSWPVRLMPGMDHIDISLKPQALDAAVQLVDALNSKNPASQSVVLTD